MEFAVDATLDTIGTLCPVPIHLTSRKMKGLRKGQVLEILSDDEAILSDMPAWCKTTGHEILRQSQNGNQVAFYIRKRAD